MKKILLTLIAVAAVFVACDKDALDQDVTNINVLEQAEEIGATVDSDKITIEDAMNFLNSIEGTPSKRSSSVTGKTGPAGSNFIHVALFDHNSSPYAVLSSEDGTEVCFGNLANFHSSILYVLDESASILNVEIEHADGTITNEAPASLSPALLARFQGASHFGGSLDQLIVNTNSDRNSATTGSVPAANLFDFSCTTTPSVDDYFDFSAAPFPLQGTLATKKSTAPAALANYAGTSRESMEATLMTAIQAVQ